MKAFDLTWWKILFQIINFAILVFLLRKFLFRPLLAVMKDRQERIQKGLELSAQADGLVSAAQVRHDELLTEAGSEADKLKNEAVASAEELRRSKIADAEQEAKDIVVKARETMKAERQKMIEDMRGQLVELVAIASRKVLGEALSEDELQSLVQRAVISSLESLEDVTISK